MLARALVLSLALLLAPGCPGTSDDDDSVANDDDSVGDDDDSVANDDDSAGDDAASLDGDGDGYPAATDCDDTEASIHPGADEVCADAVDDDCDPTTDCQGACASAWTYTAPCGAATYAGPAPLLHWSFDASGSLLADSSGNSYGGTASGTWGSVPGWLGSAGDLDEAYGEVELGAPLAWTSAQWIRLDALPDEDFAFVASNGNGTTSWTGWSVVIDSTGRAAGLVEGGASAQETFVTDPTPLCTQGWVHVALTWELGDVTLYVDGAVVGSATTSFTAIPDGELPFVVGWDGNQERRELDGRLDDLALWDSALSAADIAALVADGFCGNGL